MSKNFNLCSHKRFVTLRLLKDDCQIWKKMVFGVGHIIYDWLPLFYTMVEASKKARKILKSKIKIQKYRYFSSEDGFYIEG